MMYATRGARKPFITVLREVLNKHGAAPFDQRLLDNALRVFGCSRLECDRLVADGTNWRDVKATSVALSGTLLNQHWKAVVIARSALSNLTIDSLRCSISVIERSSLSHVMFKDVTSNVSSEQPLVLNAVRWSHGRLDGHIEMIGREGEWRDVEIAATRGRLSLGGIGLEHCRIQLIGAVVSVVNGRAGRSTVKGVAVGTTHTADVADAITRNVKRGTAGSVFDGVVFSNCLFMFVNLDAHLLRGCTFNQCFFLGCSLPSFRWLRDWPARNQQHGNMFALLSLNRSNEEGSQRGRKTRTDVTEVDQAGLRLTPELASQLKTERVMIADASRTRGPDWYGFTADAMKAASRYNGPPLERIAVELTADDLF
jgi:hypothetical protein